VPTDPVVGDKRPREEDGASAQQPTRSPPQEIQPSGNARMDVSSPPQQIATSTTNLPVGPMPGMNQHGGVGGIGMTGPGASHDALYIGDLQWVRLFCRLDPCLYRSEKSWFSPDPF
jgi:hypothetical protein